LRSVAPQQLTPVIRRLLLLAADAALLSLALWLSFWLRLDQPISEQWLQSGPWMVAALWIFGLPLLLFTGQYKGLTRYVGSRSLYQLAGRTAVLTLVVLAVGALLRLPSPPRSCWILLWVLATTMAGALRFTLRDVFFKLANRQVNASAQRVVIYGAGAAGIQLAASLRHSGTHRLLAFVDDDPSLWGRSIGSVEIKPPRSLPALSHQLDQVLLAIPSIKKIERRRIVDSVQSLGCSILEVPSIDALTSGRASIDALHPIAIEDLLGRDQVAPDPELLGRAFAGKVVCVTGAGGSIGSELCRQIVQLEPAALLLLERSEPALYAIDQALSNLGLDAVKLRPVLGSASDEALVRELFAREQVQVVVHAAAYKHVPLVEANPLAGIANNVFSTRVICQTAAALGLERVLLISTDKAVRPTNVMGASKRLAELVVQGAAKTSETTSFSMVRFGNVLGSSGSVVPLFSKQIKAGGPITLTHPEIVRYFMTIPEATQLVLQAAGMATGGEVFVLDMGEPVRIQDLAQQMVKLSGLQLKDVANPEGDIEIKCTGLRPGEKLYEELLIDADSQPTAHPLICCAQETSWPVAQLETLLDQLQQMVQQQDLAAVLDLLKQLVPEWQQDPAVSTQSKLVLFSPNPSRTTAQAG
jgi:FlaA1/EpsC-like NDP-sugar epimerase